MKRKSECGGNRAQTGKPGCKLRKVDLAGGIAEARRLNMTLLSDVGCQTGMAFCEKPHPLTDLSAVRAAV